MGGVLIKVGVAKNFARVYVKCPLNFQHLPTPMYTACSLLREWDAFCHVIVHRKISKFPSVLDISAELKRVLISDKILSIVAFVSLRVTLSLVLTFAKCSKNNVRISW